MAYTAKILADSLSPDGVRLTTIEATFPRICLAEANTHRVLSRCSASSRAIPVEKRIAMIEADPFIPEQFGKNQKRMQASELLEPSVDRHARIEWEQALASALRHARVLRDLGVHKQLANRLLEPFAWHTAIISATEWDNFFHLRCHPNAQPEFRKIAEMMRDAMKASEPKRVPYGEWHLPLTSEEDNYTFDDGDPAALPHAELIEVSIARCARVSYLTHEGKRDIEEDLKLYGRLVVAGHCSPLEHVARPMTELELEYFTRAAPEWNGPPFDGGPFCGNFRGWVQWRKLVIGEDDILNPARSA